jgi:hypothetical protein
MSDAANDERDDALKDTFSMAEQQLPASRVTHETAAENCSVVRFSYRHYHSFYSPADSSTESSEVE